MILRSCMQVLTCVLYNYIILITLTNGDETNQVNANNVIITSAVNSTTLQNNTALDTDDEEENLTYAVTSPAPSTKPNMDVLLPEKGAAEAEHHSSMAIFLVLMLLALSILLVHLLLQTQAKFLPESLSVVFLGAIVGLILQLLSAQNIGNFQQEEAFSPTAFFLILLPPIIFESGYNLHKGNFFHNIGSILLFAIVGTLISALVIGSGVYILGLADVAYHLSFVESFAFGSLISAVDPVATLAIFHALDVDPVLNMLVFGESILNDAVSIVLTSTILEAASPSMAHLSPTEAILQGVGRFCLMFFASSAIGGLFALASALLLKHVDLRKNPSLELAMMLVFTYAPYTLAEGLHLSGIMAILFCGIVMSHYTHFNLSTVTQLSMQQTMRTLSFIAETCVFAYLGLAIFSFPHQYEGALVAWSLALCLLGRAMNIFPLAMVANKFREHKITPRMMFIMWFSGLRGAIAYALALHLEFESETRHVLVTTTLIIVLVTIIIFGGSTMPLLKVWTPHTDLFKKAIFEHSQMLSKPETALHRRQRRRREKEISLSKTREMGQTIDSEHLSELTEEELELTYSQPGKGFAYWDLHYLSPFFTRRFTQQELRDCHTQMTHLTDQWYQAIKVTTEDSEEESTPKETTRNNNINVPS